MSAVPRSPPQRRDASPESPQESPKVVPVEQIVPVTRHASILAVVFHDGTGCRSIQDHLVNLPSRVSGRQPSSRPRARAGWRPRRRRILPTCRHSRPAAPPTAACLPAGARRARGRREARAAPVPPSPTRRRGPRRACPTRSTLAVSVYAVDHDPHEVAVPELPDRTTGQGLRRHVPDAGAGRDAREPGVGQQRHVLAPRHVLERRRQLVGLLHSRAHRARSPPPPPRRPVRSRPAPAVLIAAMAARSLVKTRARPVIR